MIYKYTFYTRYKMLLILFDFLLKKHWCFQYKNLHNNWPCIRFVDYWIRCWLFYNISVYYNHTQKCLFPKCIGLDKICCIAVEGITVGYMTSPAVPVPQAEKKMIFQETPAYLSESNIFWQEFLFAAHTNKSLMAALPYSKNLKQEQLVFVTSH